MIPLVVVAHATPSIGAGHVMRCATLCEAWSRAGNGSATLVGEVTLPFVAKRLREAGVTNRDAFATGDGVGGVLLVDSYDETDRRRGIEWGNPTLRVLVDDLGAEVESGYDVVLNPNPYAGSRLYPGFRGAVVAGPEAVLARSGLPLMRPRGGTAVLLGGGGPSAPLLQALARVSTERLEFGPWLGVGDWTPAEWSRVPSDQAWEGVSSAERMLVAAGGATWEAAAVGARVALVLVAENQRPIGAWAEHFGVPVVDAINRNDSDRLSVELAEAILAAGRLPILPAGGDHVARCIWELATRRGR